MATVSTLSGSSSGGNTARRVPYVVEAYIDFAEAATAKGSALAAADVIEALEVPAGVIAIAGGIEVLEAADGDAAAVTLDMGVTGGDVDAFADGFSFHNATVGAYSAPASGAPIVVTEEDTIDILLATATTAPVSGKIRVFAVLVDVDGVGETDEVSRDQLA